MNVVVTPDFDWRAKEPDGDRHAFPRRDGFPPPSLCEQERWTVRFGEHGAGYCPFCLDRLKAILSGVTTALEEAEAGE